MAKRVTLRDIGKVAEVHHTTVSLALRNHPSLPEQTRKRIRRIAEELGYRPDPVLSALNAYKTSRMREVPVAKIAVVINVPDLGDPNFESDYFSRTLDGARRRALTYGYDLDVFNIAEESLSAARLETVLKTRSIQGMILAYFRDSGSMDLNWDDFSAVKIEHLPHEPALNVVCSSQMQAAELSLAKLKERGYRRVAAVLNTMTDLKLGHYYSAGFKAFNDIFPPEDRIPPLYFDEYEDLAAKLPEFLRRHRPDALISDWNQAVVDLCKANGYDVPRDLGFASLSLHRGKASMSGVLPSYERVGELAVDIVAQMLRSNERGLPDQAYHVFVDGAWEEGETLRPSTAV